MAKAMKNQGSAWFVTGLGYGAAMVLAARLNAKFAPAVFAVEPISSPNWFGLVVRKGSAKLQGQALVYVEAFREGVYSHSQVQSVDEAHWVAWRAARCETCVHFDKPCAGCVARVQAEAKAQTDPGWQTVYSGLNADIDAEKAKAGGKA